MTNIMTKEIDLIKISKIKHKSQLKKYHKTRPLNNLGYLFHYLILTNNLDGLKLYNFPIHKNNIDGLNGIMLAAREKKYKILDYLLNKKHVKCVLLLSMYILIINNHNIINYLINSINVFKLLVSNIRNNLKDQCLNNEQNISKLKVFFKKYFKQKPDDCINIMKNWEILFNELIN